MIVITSRNLSLTGKNDVSCHIMAAFIAVSVQDVTLATVGAVAVISWHDATSLISPCPDFAD